MDWRISLIQRQHARLHGTGLCLSGRCRNHMPPTLQNQIARSWQYQGTLQIQTTHQERITRIVGHNTLCSAAVNSNFENPGLIEARTLTVNILPFGGPVHQLFRGNEAKSLLNMATSLHQIHEDLMKRL